MNWYAYVASNPLLWADPEGLFADWLWDVGAIAISAGDFVAHPGWGTGAALAADVVLGVVPVVPAGVGAARKGISAARAAQAARGTRGARAACEAATELHHTVPKAVPKKLPPEVRRGVRGKRGAPNRIPLPRPLHRGAKGGQYNDFWFSRLRMLDGGPAAATVEDVLRIRGEAISRFGLLEYAR